MTQTERIAYMEALFDKSEGVVKRLERALEDFAGRDRRCGAIKTDAKK